MVEGSNPLAVALADLNGDGRLDLIVANLLDDSVGIRLGNGDGNFATLSSTGTGARPTALAIGDLNGDGRADLITADRTINSVGIRYGQGDGSFDANPTPALFAVGVAPSSVALFDLDGDGRRDIITVNPGNNTVSVLLNLGAGSFAPAVNYGAGGDPRDVAFADVNGDGRTDMVVADFGDQGFSVLLGNGAGGFGSAATRQLGSQITSLQLADLNGDGRTDLVTANVTSNEVFVLLGNGNGLFGPYGQFGPAPWPSYAVGAAPGKVVLADVTNDGRLDIITTSAVNGSVTVLTGNGGGGFSARQDFAAGAGAAAVAVGDINGDGLADIAVTNPGAGTATLLLNSAGRGPVVTLDTFAPAPVLSLTTGTGGVSHDGLITASGVEVGATLQYSINGGASWTAGLTLAAGANSIQARQIDLAGNTSAASAALVFTSDVAGVSTASGLNSAILAIDAASLAGAGAGTRYTVTLAAAATLTETANLAAIALKGADTLTIQGQGAHLDGVNAYRGLVVTAGQVAIQNLTIERAIAAGVAGGDGQTNGRDQSSGGTSYWENHGAAGGGGGGGAGLGGGLFVGQAANVTLSGVTFTLDQAIGGQGGRGGQGFIYYYTLLGDGDGNGGAGGAPGGGAGGQGATNYNGVRTSTVGTAGDFGGGGGGGGGGGDLGAAGPGRLGGAGGFGAGSGGHAGAYNPFSAANDLSGGGGGGGLGAGGDIFVDQGGVLSVLGGSTLNGGTATGGAAGAASGTGAFISPEPGSAGVGLGGAIFLRGTQTLSLGAGQTAGQTTLISGVIADLTGSGGVGVGRLLIGGADAGGVTGLGTVKLGGANTFTGGVTLLSGTLELGQNVAAGSGGITIAAGVSATLLLDAGITPGNTITGFDTGDVITLKGFGASATYTVSGQTVRVTDGVQTDVLNFAPGQLFLANLFNLTPQGGDIRFTAGIGIDAGSPNVSHVNGAGPVVLDSALRIATLNGPALTGATLSISSGFLAGDQLRFTDQSGITGAYNAATGVLNLSGSASDATYQAALRSVAYDSTIADPSANATDTARGITWQVQDGALLKSSTSTIAIVPAAISGISTAAALSAAIALINIGSQGGAGTGQAYSITLAPGLRLVELANLNAINLKGSDTLTIDGAGSILDGGNAYRGVVVTAGHVTLKDIGIEHALVQGATGANGGDGIAYNSGAPRFVSASAGGGGGGGGGPGLGGALYVSQAGVVTLSNVDFLDNRAIGGAGGAGGGSINNGAFPAGGAGGVGADGGGNGGRGAFLITGFGSGYNASGGGSGAFGAGGGGGGGADAFPRNVDPYSVTPGGGGGGGGFGANGGGAGDGARGLDFGFKNGGAGGSGLGAGGDIFVEQGASISILAGSSLLGGTATGGAALGGAIFLKGAASVALGAGLGAGQTILVNGTIADQAGGSLVIGGNGGLGAVKLTAANSFTGGVMLLSGTLELGHNSAAGTGALTFAPGTDDTLLLDAGVSIANTIVGFDGTDRITLSGFGPGVTLGLTGQLLSVTAGGVTDTFRFDPGQVVLANEFVASTAGGVTTITAGLGIATSHGPVLHGGAPVLLDAALLVVDVARPDLTGATVAIGTGFLAGDLLGYTNQNGITGSYDANSGVLTLSGTATVANYQAALRSVTFDFASGDATNGGTDTSRGINWQVTDGLATRGDSSSLQVVATSITGVGTASDLSAQIAVINNVSRLGQGGGAHYSITLAAGLTLTEAADVTAIRLKGADTLTIDGLGSVLDGAGAYRGFTVITGHVVLANLTLQNMLAKGGDGGGGEYSGGGGAGLGGALFLASGADVTLSQVTMANNRAQGGRGGLDDYTNFSFYDIDAAGGGGGLVTNGQAAIVDARHGAGGSGDAAGGNTGGAAGPFNSYPYVAGGAGGYGGGGGGADVQGGAGGFGGGGGGGLTGGNGGFGGGGGSNLNGEGNGGFGGGYGLSAAYGGGGGGGGLGAGGDIFVQQGARLSYGGGSTGTGSTVVAGAGATIDYYGTEQASEAGQALGAGLFLQGDGSIRLGAGLTAGQVLTIGGAIADQRGSGGTGTYTLRIGDADGTGQGIVKLAVDNSYSGRTFIDSGTLELGANRATGSTAQATGAAGAQATGNDIIVFGIRATLMIDAGVLPNRRLLSFSDDDAIDLLGFGAGTVLTRGLAAPAITMLGVVEGANSLTLTLLTPAASGRFIGIRDDGAGGSLLTYLKNPTGALSVDTGILGDGITSNGRIDVGGLQTGFGWQYSVNGGAFTAGTGTGLTLTGDGLKQVTLRQIDRQGTVSPVTTLGNFTLDTTAPVLTITSPAGATHLSAQTIIGTGEAGGTVTIRDGMAVLGTASIDAGGNWSQAVTLGAALGVHAITAASTDLAGNTGTSAAVFYTRIVNAPGFSITVSGAAGQAAQIITGTGPAGTTVTILDGDALVGSTTVDGSGKWSSSVTLGSALGVHGITVAGTGAMGQLVDVSVGLIGLAGAADGLAGPDAACQLVANPNLASTLTAGDADTVLWGGNGDDTLNGGTGQDVLVGGPGQDSLSGGTGNDLYGVDDVGDVVVESAGAGYDSVYVSVSGWVAGPNLELIALTGTATSVQGGAGNETIGIANGNLASTLDGAAGDDVLWGGSGNDMLIGGMGNDVLVGGAGNDSMSGGAGDDAYSVDSIGDVVTEDAGGGFDAVYVSVSGWVAGNSLEVIALTGGATSVLGGAGNEIIGLNNSNLASTLDGGAGDDTLWGGSGDDVLIGGAGNDALVGGAGADLFAYTTAAAGDDRILDFSRAEGDLIRIAFAGGPTGFAALTLVEAAGNTEVFFGATRIEVHGVTGMMAGDFLFA